MGDIRRAQSQTPGCLAIHGLILAIAQSARDAVPATTQKSCEVPDFATVFRDNAAFVWRALLGLGVAEADVQDASQLVFLVLHRRLESFDGSSSLRTFIYGICLRVASEQRRKVQRRRERFVEEIPEQAVSAVQVAHAAARQALERLESALERLPGAQREVFVLFEVEELSMEETAHAVGCPLFTAYARLRAARKALASEFKEAWITLDTEESVHGRQP